MAIIDSILMDGDDVNMPALRNYLAGVKAQLDAQGLASGTGTPVPFETIALRDADTSQADGTLCYVFKQNGLTNDPANKFYQWNDAGAVWVDAEWYNLLLSSTPFALISDTTSNDKAVSAANFHSILNQFVTYDAVNDNYFFGGSGNATATGTNNIGNGPNAALSLTTGSRNFTGGRSSGRLNTTGSDNVLIGDETGDGFGAINNSVAIGSGAFARGAGTSVVDCMIAGAFAGRVFAADGLTAIGAFSFSQATGERSTGVGAYSGSQTTTGVNQTLVGYNTQGGATLNYTIAIGYDVAADAEGQITIGRAENTHMKVFGQKFARWHIHASGDNFWLLETGPTSAPTGFANMAVGKGSAPAITSGYLLTASGFDSLKAATTAFNCVAIGAYAATAAISAGDSVWVGAKAGQDTVSGVGDTAVGFRSMQKTTVARNNTGVGDSTFFVNQGSSGVAIGYTTAEYMTNGTSGVFIGANAARARLNAERCIYIGDAAGEITSNYVNCVPATGAGGTAAGVDNIGIGTASLNEFLGSRVVAIGSNAGGSLVGTVDQILSSVFLGFYSGFHASQKTDAANSIAIGAGTYTTADNQVVIGNPANDNFTFGSTTFSTANLNALKALVA